MIYQLKNGNLSKNPFFSVLCNDDKISVFLKISYKSIVFSEAEYREFVINKILKDESNL
jgi:hypothetical protein